MPAPSFPGVSPATRRAMQANRGKDTKPEMAVRRLVHGMGYRYRLHRKDLPGKPDLVFGPRRKAIFVHGCFWHAHSCLSCGPRTAPKTRPDYWQAKFKRDRERDAFSLDRLVNSGWSTLVIWECEVRNVASVSDRVRRFLELDGLSVHEIN